MPRVIIEEFVQEEDMSDLDVMTHYEIDNVSSKNAFFYQFCSLALSINP